MKPRRFRPTERVAAKEVDGETVLLDLEEGSFFVSRGVGPRVWERLAAGDSIEEIADSLKERYEISREQALSDLEAFVTSLSDKGFIEELAEASPLNQPLKDDQAPG